jgi:hypothetical protein
LIYFALVGCLGIAVSVGAQTPSGSANPDVPADPGVQPAANQAAAAASPLDRPLQLANLARATYQKIQNYTCLMIKQEHIDGQLQPENVIEMTLRNQPFSVYLRWLAPRQFVGQEACYVAGRNNNMMRVHTTGLAGAFGFVSIAPDDPRVLKNSRHLITEAGIGNLLEKLARGWDQERRQGGIQVRIADYEYNRRRCTRVETTHTERSANPSASYRTVVYFDNEHHLPVRIERYDWPRQGGNTGGDLLECYSYINLRFNAQLDDRIFNH